MQTVRSAQVREHSFADGSIYLRARNLFMKHLWSGDRAVTAACALVGLETLDSAKGSVAAESRCEMGERNHRWLWIMFSRSTAADVKVHV